MASISVAALEHAAKAEVVCVSDRACRWPSETNGLKSKIVQE
jgi:hypothetical protein